MDAHMSALGDLWQEATRDHPFLVAVRTGAISPDAFNRWLVQDCLFVRSFLPFVAHLLTKQPPPNHLDTLSTVETTLRDEIAWFVEKGEARGLEMTADNRRALPTTTAYMGFLEEVSREADYPTHLAIYWLIEVVYQQAWSSVLDGGAGAEPYKEFALRWGSPEFGAFCDLLKRHASEAVRVYEGDEAAQRRLQELLKRILELENSFWQMAMEQ